MFIVYRDRTSPVVLRQVALALAQLQTAQNSALLITREDDWALTRAVAFLQGVLAADQTECAS